MECRFLNIYGDQLVEFDINNADGDFSGGGGTVWTDGDLVVSVGAQSFGRRNRVRSAIVGVNSELHNTKQLFLTQ